jgi:hypothetical protein
LTAALCCRASGFPSAVCSPARAVGANTFFKGPNTKANHESTKGRKHEREDDKTGRFPALFCLFRVFVLSCFRDLPLS